jgi:hypothetical protein
MGLDKYRPGYLCPISVFSLLPSVTANLKTVEIQLVSAFSSSDTPGIILKYYPYKREHYAEKDKPHANTHTSIYISHYANPLCFR